MKISPLIQKKLKTIKALLLDCDGVMTDGRIWQDSSGEWRRSFHILDGMGIRMLIKNGFIVGVITGSKGKDIVDRCKHLGIEHLYPGTEDKFPAYKNFLEKTQLHEKEVAYIGDDIIDIPVLENAGFSATVPDAINDVFKHTHYTTKRAGGYGAVREICDLILKYSKNTKKD